MQRDEPQAVLDYHRPSPAPGGWSRLVTWSLCLLPLVAMTPALLMYGVAWATLGHPPRHSIDDPKNLPVEPFYSMTPFACLLWPVSLIVTPLWLIAKYHGSRRRGWIWGAWCMMAAMPFVFAYLTDFISWYAD